jgi:electron-transferring-flavoprotein dehydrogenase
VANAGLLLLSGGSWRAKERPFEPDAQTLRPLARLGGRSAPAPVPLDGKYTLDKDNDVYYSGALHEEDQPPHLVVSDYEICRTRCREEYGNPCEKFCPAHVYEMVPDEERGGVKLILHANNCVHCKTCDVLDPYGIITWVTPEGGGGPDYVEM